MITEVPVTISWQLPSELSEPLLAYAAEVARLNGADENEADDVAQSTLLSLHNAAARNPAVVEILRSDKWKGYVATAARNALVALHRSEARRRRREEQSTRLDSAVAVGSLDWDNLEAVLLLEELSVDLSSEERLFLHLRYFVGMKMREIAETMGISRGRLSHLGRGAQKKVERSIIRTE